MTTYNGLAVGEERTVKVRPKAGDNGHSLVRMTTIRPTSRFKLHYRARCECGQVFRSKISVVEISYAHRRHKRTELRKAEWGQQPG